MSDLTRRTFMVGTGAVLFTPAIVRAGSLMPVRMIGGTECDYFTLFCASQNWWLGITVPDPRSHLSMYQGRFYGAHESLQIREGKLRDAPCYRRYEVLRPRTDIVLFPAAPEILE